MSNYTTDAHFWMLRWLLAAAIVVVGANAALAQDEPKIVQVEEDWELVVGDPDPSISAPQVLCVFSPTDNVQSLHASLELNHHTVPEFAAGGMQFEVWQGKLALRERKFPIQAVMSTPGEVVSWTQSMSIQGCGLTFEVKNGTSSTWGSFGGQGYLKPYPVQTSLSDLNGYSPELSVANSGVSYAANRVQSLVLKRVRVTFSTGETVEDATPRVVHSLDK